MLLDGRPVQRKIKEGLKEEYSLLPEKPHLYLLEWTEGESSFLSQDISHFGQDLGVEVSVQRFPPECPQEEVLDFVRKISSEKAVHGIVPLAPVPPRIDRIQLGLEIPIFKDIDAFNPESLGRLFLGKPLFIPSTAKAVLSLLDFYGIPLESKRVVILGRSPNLGKPLALLFLARNSTVTVCHSLSRDLPFLCRQAEILVSAMGLPRKVDRSFVKEGAVVVDVGATLIGGKIVGDVRFEEVVQNASWISPVPGGVGPVATASLFENLLSAVKLKLS
ncbi:MAG: bifunctional 5,10-methylenetetrahydrofolate dehydrogenase/5,10-methenyltetrahydrofolate cyclohydrolase [Caldiserica bacterium]|jgi:methylenetetrahydrofolate dehydrogenase (NADP+)/methenyltetrahydrofolate cyclohydrolase|nr:bifunctional 5,10-methylenetetrahydrofolate dehydrogenase/5,10-methenyltetrahydrofolate cyclohydrolase [Caldisericota bacterium]MDH7561770.1 bifunctional 5,10-methylenetetrahydrofolate dehydrogenase/5,10-methenyltetrahydrofolate cyclohydrolase [Caldisericota bacterium]